MIEYHSPCIGECELKDNTCIGCGRTLDECKKWKKLKPFAITRLRKDLEKRMTILNGEENG